jgi:hypothetical protein
MKVIRKVAPGVLIALVAVGFMACSGVASASLDPVADYDRWMAQVTATCGPRPDIFPIGALETWEACEKTVPYPVESVAPAPPPVAPAPTPVAPAPAPTPKPKPKPKPRPKPKPKHHKRRHKVVYMGGRSDAPAVSRTQYNLEMDIGRYYENDIEAFASCRYPTMTWTHHGIDRKDAWPRFRYRCTVDFVDDPAGGRETMGTATVTYDLYRGSWHYRWHKGG